MNDHRQQYQGQPPEDERLEKSHASAFDAPGAFGQKIREHLVVRQVGGDAAVVGVELVAIGAEALEEPVEFRLVLGADRGRLGDE